MLYAILAYHEEAKISSLTSEEDARLMASLLELQAVMPEVTLHPYPVATGTVNAQRWWATAGDARQMIVEYSKYLVILSREAMRSIGGGQSAPADASAPA